MNNKPKPAKIIKPSLRLVRELEPNAPGRKPMDPHQRFWLTPDEVAVMTHAAAKNGAQRFRQRNVALVTLCYRHGLRVSELCNLKWSQIDFVNKCIYIARSKLGDSGVHPLPEDEIAVLQAMTRKNEWVFYSNKGNKQITRNMAWRIITSLGEIAQLEVHAHPHMLRHGRGYLLVNKDVSLRKIQGLLGHKSIRNTQRYTSLAAHAYEGLCGHV